MFHPVARGPRLSDHVAELILETIKTQSLAPGSKLPSERELGEQFGVSRTVIREAVRALSAKGIIDVRSGSGLRVAQVEASTVTESMGLFLRGLRLDYRKVHEVRALIEIEVAGLAAERAGDDDLHRIAANLEQMAKAAGEVERSAELDVEFHRLVASATHNELHVVLLDSIGDVLLDVRRATLARPGRVGEALIAHQRIADALTAKEPDAARAAMRAHLEDSARAWDAVSGKAS